MSNISFRLGDEFIVRLPQSPRDARRLETEFTWLPRLSKQLSLPIAQPLELGQATERYPWPWAVYRWIDGAVALPQNIANLPRFAEQLASFLKELQSIDPDGAPQAGAESHYRGGPLARYDGEAREAISRLQGRMDASVATALWDQALTSKWAGDPVWFHGDVSAENLLVRDGSLCGVIDFGNFGIGDPACDLAMGWNIFDDQSRQAFRSVLPVDEGTWNRGRAWVLWKAMIIASGLCHGNAYESSLAEPIIARTLHDFRTANR